MDVATDGFCNCKVSVLLLAQFFLGGYRHSGRVLRTPILPLGKKSKFRLITLFSKMKKMNALFSTSLKCKQKKSESGHLNEFSTSLIFESSFSDFKINTRFRLISCILGFRTMNTTSNKKGELFEESTFTSLVSIFFCVRCSRIRKCPLFFLKRQTSNSIPLVSSLLFLAFRRRSHPCLVGKTSLRLPFTFAELQRNSFFLTWCTVRWPNASGNLSRFRHA